jgi:sarcosine oxidase subunit alpha
MTAYRLASGGLINRNETISFNFDGKAYTGFAGDTLASALLANGVTLLGRSFKYHRPRGILSAGAEEPNAIVELRTGAYREPNTRATVAEIFDGLVASSQNRFPSLKYDVLSINSLLSPLFAAGFYYKTFMWPAAFWEKLYEPLIRRAAGLGRAAGLADPDSYEKTTLFCDVLVIGGGIAGMAAARDAAKSGGRVILCDEGSQLGGDALADATPPDISGLDNITILTRTTVFGVYDGGTYGALERLTDHLPSSTKPRQRLIKIIAGRSVLATGAIERPLVFHNNDLPGVMLAGAVRTYVNRYAVAPGSRVVVATCHDETATIIAALSAAGIAVAAVVDSRTKSTPAIRDAAFAANAPLFAGGQINRAHGRLAVAGTEILSADGGLTTVACDLIAMSGGWSPSLHLTSYLNDKPVWNDALAAFVPAYLPPGMMVTGWASGAGINPNIVPLWQSGHGGKAFVDFQNDVTAKDITLAKQEGFVAVEHLKRYTTLGMATDQGKTANVNAIAIMAAATGRTVPDTGTTRFRPPYTPVAIGAFAGAHRGKYFKPTRLTPTHEWAAAQGAVFIETGLWLRAQYFPKPGEDWFAATQREVKTVRGSAGFCDVTTLGKIDIQGPDAAKFLECVYTNGWTNLPIGRARYGLMLREDGFVMDDGTCARLGETHFIMTTTTANAAKVMQHLEFCHQVLWPELDVSFISVTDQWAQIALAGPQSRAVLETLVDAPFDISNEAFPYMAAASLTMCGGAPARLFRLSFSGELAYEMAVPARFGHALAMALAAAGASPYGTEALGVMRIEKGHPAGAELNGTTTAHDLGLAKLLSKKKDFVGRAMAARPELTDPSRPTLVGLKPADGTTALKVGSHLLTPGAEATLANDQGYITAAAFSPSLGHPIALALLSNGPARLGEKIRVYDPVRHGDTLAEITSPVFYDPDGSRLHA